MKNKSRLLSLLAACAIGSMALTGGSPAPQDTTRVKPQPAPQPTDPARRPVPVPGQQPGQHKPGEYPYGNLGSPVYRARAEMRQVWGEHVAYTRNYIISAVAGLPDAVDVSNRLLQNADEIGRVFQPYYGDASSKKLATLLRDHVKILAELTQVVSQDATSVATAPGRSGTTPGKTGATGNTGSDKYRGYGNDRTPGDVRADEMRHVDKEALSGIQQRLEANATAIATFLNTANPNWKQSDFEGMMQSHVDHLIDQIDARLNGDWQADIQAFDQALDHAFRFADALSQGIERQFPDRFAQAKS